MHFKAISAWTVGDVASGAIVALLVIGAIVVIALIFHGRRDAVRNFMARATWRAFAYNTWCAILIMTGLLFAIMVALSVAAYAPWPTIVSILAAVPAIIAMPFEAVWNMLTDRPLGEELLIIAIVVTWLIIAAIRRASDRIVTAMAMTEANKRRDHK